MAGNYTRTEEVRLKQSIKMKEKIKEYNFDDIDKKRKETMKRRNVRSGRRKGEGPKKTGWFKKCKCCDNEFWVIPSNSDNKLYCSRICLHDDEDYREKQKKYRSFIFKGAKVNTRSKFTSI